MPGTTGSSSPEGIPAPYPISTLACPGGSVSLKDQMGWSPFSVEILTRIREPLKHTAGA